MENKSLQFDNTTHEPKKNWWQRNWKWFVPTGCLSLLIIVAILIYGVFTAINSVIKESTLYVEAFEKVANNTYVIDQIGEPIEQDGIFEGNVSVSNDDGDADLRIPFKGSKSKAVLHVVAYKQDGEWIYETLTITIDKTKEEIDLLKE